MIVRDFDPTAELRVTFPMSLRREVEINGQLFQLQWWAYRIFIVLLICRGRFLRRVDIVEEVWPNPDDEPDSSVRIIHRAMQYMRDFGIPVETWHGQGWRIPLPIRDEIPSNP